MKLVATIILSTALFSPNAAFSFAEDLPNYHLSYNITAKGTGLGTLEIKVESNQEKETVVVHGETFPNAIANMIGDGKAVEIIEYKNVRGELQLSRVEEKLGRGEGTVKSAVIDHKRNQINIDDEKFPLTKRDQLDSYTYPFLMLMGVTDTDPGSKERLVNVKKVRDYIYHETVTEEVKTDAGTFMTTKLSKTRTDGSKTIAVWVTQDRPKMPVRILVTKRQKKQIDISLAQRIN